MDLKTFISNTLIEIQEGVADAIHRRTASPIQGGAINPSWGVTEADMTKSALQKLEFDVAVTIGGSEKGGGQGKIKIFSVEIGGDGSISREHSNVSRIKFAVPFIPPTQHIIYGDSKELTVNK